MEYVIKLLQKERETIVESLRNGQQERLQDLQQVDKAIGWLKLIQDNNLEPAGKYHLDALPMIEGHGGFATYRIMIDDDTDDTAHWEEYRKQTGGHYCLSLGDFLLVHST
ncbi:MAG: hypothetical protein K2M91_09550 [Lachnospiraceae bacterium]|nr:hypothetical protein [Lachnospiraceae bacterium]